MLNFITSNCVVVLLYSLMTSPCFHSEYIIQVDAEKSVGSLFRFWDSTGFSPPAAGKKAFDYLTSQDVKSDLMMIGSLPFSAVKQVRIHWLLDLITIRKDSENCTFASYEFKHLDGLLDMLVKFNLTPGFELMGNPGGYFNDLNKNKTQIRMWKNLVTSIATRYIDRYGLTEVMGWRFETWNEPDLAIYNILNFTLPGYLRYVRVCRTGLDKACAIFNNNQNDNDNNTRVCHLQLGGPAGLFKNKRKHKLCWGLLRYCTDNKQRVYRHSRFDQKKKDICGLDFISFHKKGGGSPKNVVDSSEQFYGMVKTKYKHRLLPNLFNDEADLLTGWWRNESWRADVRYAAAVSKVLVMFHRQRIVNNRSDVIYISNDNAFINYGLPVYYFTQRTLLARFVMSDNCHEIDETHAQLFQKPVYVVLGMLAYLYNYLLDVSLLPADERLDVIATSSRGKDDNGDWNGAVLIVFSSVDDVSAVDNTSTSILISIKLPKSILKTGGKYAVYQLDNQLPHPFDVWTSSGSPENPDALLRHHMRQAQGPHRVAFNNITGSLLRFNISLTMPSVSLISLCQFFSHTSLILGQVSRVGFINVTFNEVLVLWSDKDISTRCIKTYQVEFFHLGKNKKENGNGREFTRINEYDIIFPSFHYSPLTHIDTEVCNENNDSKMEEATVGLYRIRAVDYWDRPGPYSPVVRYG